MMLPPPAKSKAKVQEAGAAKVAAAGPPGSMLPPAPKRRQQPQQPQQAQQQQPLPPPPPPQQQKQQQMPPPRAKDPPPAINYTAPKWSGEPVHPFAFEVIKNGSVVETLDVSSKPFLLIGRQEDVCDIAMQHPSISRQHAVLQHRQSGEVYVYELGSTHGTFLNKRRLQSKEHVELSVGDVLRFGASTRLYCLQGPDDLRKEVLRDKHSPAELQKMKYDLLQQRKKQAQERQEAAAAAAAAAEQLSNETCMWGEREDAQEEEDLGSARRAAADASGGLSSFGSAQRVQSTWEIEKEMKATEEKKAGMSDRELKLLEKVSYYFLT
jgi:pSer/pThr/pTyr-binding forkhead associated (FHA) protein